MTTPRLKKSQLGQLNRLASGGQGVVYEAPNARMAHAASMVFKEYKPGVQIGLAVAVLDQMPGYLESLPRAEGMDLLERAAWPCRLVEEDTSTAVVGFVMPTIPAEFFIQMSSSKGPTRKTAEFQHLLNRDAFLAKHNIPITDRGRYTLLVHAAQTLVILHNHAIAVGDLSPKNLLFSLQPDPKTYFIDCDAMRFRSRSVSPQVETPGWEVHAVNAGEELATPQSDAYKFGLLALRLFVGDQQTRDPADLPSRVPPPVRQLVTAALSASPAARPAPDAWLQPLTDAAAAAAVAPPTPAPPTPPRPSPSWQQQNSVTTTGWLPTAGVSRAPRRFSPRSRIKTGVGAAAATLVVLFLIGKATDHNAGSASTARTVTTVVTVISNPEAAAVLPANTPAPPAGTPAPAAPPPAAPPPAPTDPASVIRAYYAAINDFDYPRAWSFVAPNGSSYQNFANGFATTKSDELSISSVNGDLVYIVLSALHTDGTIVDYSGYYVVQNGLIVSASINVN